jgi:hypothetical protein
MKVNAVKEKTQKNNKMLRDEQLVLDLIEEQKLLR